MPAAFEDFYATLGLSRSATGDEIQRAYRKLARELHPDVNKAPEAVDRFKRVAEAYEVLKDADKRAKYDQYGQYWKQADQAGGMGGNPFAGGGPGGYGGSGGGAGGRSRGKKGKRAGASPVDETPFGSNFSDFFGSMFGGDQQRQWGGSPFGPEGMHNGQGGRAAPVDRNQRIETTITLREAILGGTRSIGLRYPDGSSKSFDVRIRPGTRTGDVIRLAGQGGPSADGGPAADLLVTITIAPDPRYRVQGDDLVGTLMLTPWEATLGCKVDWPLMDGSTVAVTVPPGTGSGKRLRLKGRGFPPPAQSPERAAGDVLLETAIVVPSELTDRERALLEELAAISSLRPRG